MSPSVIAHVPRAEVLELVEWPTIARALWWSTLVDESISREWLLALGQRRAEARMAHLFCEIAARYGLVGIECENGYDLPFTQIALGKMLGITPAHTNRIIRQLREAGFVSGCGKVVHVTNLVGLRKFCEFCPHYLHLPPVPLVTSQSLDNIME